MTQGEEMAALAEEVACLAPALAGRLRALAWRVAERERVLDELADEGIAIARAAWEARQRAG